MCVCVCVCVWERERERKFLTTTTLSYYYYDKVLTKLNLNWISLRAIGLFRLCVLLWSPVVFEFQGTSPFYLN